MTFWFFLLLGLLTYWTVQRSVAGITRTPVWILWLVLMTPALIWGGWTLVHGTSKTLPQVLLIGPLIVCPVLYWVLFLWGRRGPNPPAIPQTEPPAPELIKRVTPVVENVTLRPIDQTEEKQLRNCFSWSVYYIQNIEYRAQAVICRGQLRTSPDKAYEQISANIQAQFGDRFLIVFQEGPNDKPFFVLVPNPQATKADTRSEPLARPFLALSLMIATLFTTTLVGVGIAHSDLATLSSNPAVLLKGLPYSLALMTILGVHELAHYLAARFYKVRTTLPYFIPVPFFLGTFGAFIQMRSPVPNRKALFDTSIAGPLAGFVVTVPLLMWGLAHSHVVPLGDKPELFRPDAMNPRYSFLLAMLSKLALGSSLTTQTAIDLHPVAVAGFLGLIVTALNLMPVGQLDGGHIVHAMFGQKNAITIGQFARFLLLGLSLVHPGRDFFLWAVILFFMPIVDEPTLNDVTELDNKRDIWGLLALALLVVIVLPVPKVLANLWQI